jgi:N-acetyl-anhydromuramyl-L-alanine amidase AmpD
VYDIKFVGNEDTNKSDRRGYKPLAIVNHISEGSMSSMISWFTSKNNQVSSAHFGVSRAGEIYQFVSVKDNAWANGLNSEQYKDARASIVQRMGINPNWYTISIEHEGIHSETKGSLTLPQKKATVWLHQYIVDQVKEIYDETIPLDKEHILRHSDIDPVRKPFCPGELFPLDEIIQSLQANSKHWAESDYDYLSANGVKVYEKRFDDHITRGEVISLMARMMQINPNK